MRNFRKYKSVTGRNRRSKYIPKIRDNTKSIQEEKYKIITNVIENLEYLQNSITYNRFYNYYLSLSKLKTIEHYLLLIQYETLQNNKEQ